MAASLTFSGLSWLWPTVGIVAAILLVMLWSYWARRGGGVRWICAALKTLGIAALALCLLEPLRTGQRAKPGANLFAIVADNSAGLQIKDSGDSETRGESLRALLNPDSGKWQAALADNFELRRFTFDSRLNATRDFSDLTFEGSASAIGLALRGIAERFQSRPLAGVLLLTDGNATDIHNSMPNLNGLPPVYPVVIGRPGGARDISVGQVTVSQTAFEDAPVSVQANASAIGLDGERVTARLLDAAGKTIEEHTIRSRKDNDTLPFRFQWRPEKPGLSFYHLRVGLSDEMESATNATLTREATLANNTSVIPVDRQHGPYRILYVSGRPNWEFKFLNRAEQADDQVQVVGLIRVALREPKFDFRGRAGETSNPLYRGSANQSPEDVERYDQPVLVRLNTTDGRELRGGFPRVPEDLYGYSAVILDDLEAAFFSADQAALLQKFVSERGGGLLMLGGMESFQGGHYQHTPIGDMLPVYLDRAADGKPPENLKLNLSREGWLQPWARLRDNESDERARLQGMPPFEVFNPTREIKPGATPVAMATASDGKEYPALVTQRFGRGRTAALMIGDIWRWGMESPESRRDMEKSWRQLIRWLVSDVPNRVELAAEPSADDPAGAVKLQVRVRDEKFQPLDDANVSIAIEPVSSPAASPGRASSPNGNPDRALPKSSPSPGGEGRGEGELSPNVIRLRAEPSLSEAGLYETTFVPHHTGGYRAAARVANAAGLEIGKAEAGWASDLAAEEFRSLQPNTALLETIAKRTGGEVIPASRLAEFARSLPTRHAPVMEAWTVPAWHTPALFAFALACLIAEWGFRRWKGMP